MTEHTQRILQALGSVAGLYADPDVLEIMVDSPERILVERAGQLADSGLRLGSAEEIYAIIGALLALNGETFQSGETVIPIRFPASEARGVAVLPPTALDGPCLVMRKLMNVGWLSWEKLIEFGSVTQEALDFLREAVLTPANLVIAGGTGAGKFTLANRVAELIPPEQRVVIVENIHELQIRHPRAVSLEAAGRGTSFQELIRVGSMMRPDWLVIGELFGAEAMRAVEILGRGHSGMTTLHANSLEDALTRLEAMCLTSNLGLGLLEIRSMIASAIQVICFQKLLPGGKRKIVEIAEIRGVENGRFVIEWLFRYNAETERLEATGRKASFQK